MWKKVLMRIRGLHGSNSSMGYVLGFLVSMMNNDG